MRAGLASSLGHSWYGSYGCESSKRNDTSNMGMRPITGPTQGSSTLAEADRQKKTKSASQNNLSSSMECTGELARRKHRAIIGRALRRRKLRIPFSPSQPVHQKRTFEGLPEGKTFCGRGMRDAIRQATLPLPRDLLIFVLSVNYAIG